MTPTFWWSWKALDTRDEVGILTLSWLKPSQTLSVPFLLLVFERGLLWNAISPGVGMGVGGRSKQTFLRCFWALPNKVKTCTASSQPSTSRGLWRKSRVPGISLAYNRSPKYHNGSRTLRLPTGMVSPQRKLASSPDCAGWRPRLTRKGPISKIWRGGFLGWSDWLDPHPQHPHAIKAGVSTSQSTHFMESKSEGSSGFQKHSVFPE